MKHWQEVIYYHSPPFAQNLLITADRYLRRRTEYGPVFREYQERLEEMQWWSREELEAWQLERLQKLIAYAYENVPAYRQLYDKAGVRPSDIRTLSDLVKLPIVTKRQIRTHRDAFIARNAKQLKPIELNTSGTTGTPFQFYSDHATESIEWALWWRHKSWGGGRLWEPMISLGGKIVVPLSQKRPPFWRFNRAEGTMWLSTFHMTPENLDLYIEQVRKSGIQLLRGYPSNLYIFAQHLAKRNVKLPMRAVFSGSEPLFEYVRDLVEDRFCCKVFDWYGVSERVVTAGQCDRHDGYHIHMENCLVEILQDEEPVGPGQFGEVVGTCLSNYTMPFIRYRTGDMSAWYSEPCSCGRGLPAITQVQTKWEDILTTADGRFISPSVLTHPFKPVRGVEKSQIIQEEPNRIVVRVVVNNAFDATQQELLVHGFLERLGKETHIEVQPVADIPKGPSGKYRWVISKVPFEFNRLLKRQREQDGVRGTGV
jgi:phenylacetate-CoA ligase